LLDQLISLSARSGMKPKQEGSFILVVLVLFAEQGSSDESWVQRAENYQWAKCHTAGVWNRPERCVRVLV